MLGLHDVWNLVETTDGRVTKIETYANRAAAEGVASLTDPSIHVMVLKTRLIGSPEEADSALTTVTPTPKTKKKKPVQVATPDEEDELLELGNDTKVKTPKAKRALTEKELAAKAARQVPPAGQPDALVGRKMFFVGTFSLEHIAYHNATLQCGGEVAKKLEEANCVLVGKKPGKKNEEVLAKCNATHISEKSFLEMLEYGSSDSQLQRYAADSLDAELPAKKKQKK